MSSRPVARGVRLVRSSPAIYSNCRGPSSKQSNIFVKIQWNLHQNELFQAKKSQNFLGRGLPSPCPIGEGHSHAPLLRGGIRSRRRTPPLRNVWLRACQDHVNCQVTSSRQTDLPQRKILHVIVSKGLCQPWCMEDQTSYKTAQPAVISHLSLCES